MSNLIAKILHGNISTRYTAVDNRKRNEMLWEQIIELCNATPDISALTCRSIGTLMIMFFQISLKFSNVIRADATVTQRNLH